MALLSHRSFRRSKIGLHLDSNQDGKIGISEFLDFSLAEKKTRLLKMFETLDTDKDGFIEFEEYVVATEPTFNILKKFRELYLDRNGLLSLEKAINIADHLVLPLYPELIRTLMKQVDRDEYLGTIVRSLSTDRSQEHSQLWSASFPTKFRSNTIALGLMSRP